MIFRQVMHDDLGCASYLVGDERTGRAAVVDPKFEIDEYLQLARYHGLSIEHILETHNHADHVSGHGRLAAATGATIHIHRLASPDYEHEPFDDGFELSLGDVRIRALHTPGHRPEHTAFLLYDVRRSQQPWALLTGDSLFVGDIARPDLAIEKHEGARGIFRSLRRMLELPEHVEIWPGHIGGSLCGGDTVDRKPVSTLGYERLHNEMLAVTDEDEFVDRATRDLPPQPPNFQAIVALNRGPLLIEGVEARPLTPRQVLLKQHAGALVVDVRTALQFDEAHVPGAVSIPATGAGFGTKLAWIADRDQEIVFVGRDDADGRRAVALAEAVGLRRIAGFLAGGMTSWREERRPVRRIERMSASELRERLATRDALQVLDVRERSEWRRCRIPGSINVPYHELTSVPPGIDLARPIATVCGTGSRAGTAASLLARLGASRVLHVADGGVATWREAGWPVEGEGVTLRA